MTEANQAKGVYKIIYDHASWLEENEETSMYSRFLSSPLDRDDEWEKELEHCSHCGERIIALMKDCLHCGKRY